MQNINKHILGDYVLDSYEYYTEWSQESQNYIAKVIEFPMLSATGETKDLALAEIKIIVNSTIESLLNSGKPVPEAIKTKNYSGKLRISIPGDLHRYLIMEAAIRNTSIDNVILHKLISDMSEEDKKHYLLQMEKK